MKIETNNGTLTIEFNENKENKETQEKNPENFGFIEDENPTEFKEFELKKPEGVIQEKVKDETTKKNIMAVVKEAFETKLDEIKNPNRFNTGQIATTVSTLDRPDIDQIADIDKDIPGYDRIRVFDSMDRKCDITIINDGSDSIYFIVNRNGIDHEEEMWSQAEIMLYPGEAWKIHDVHEMRIRSETQGNKYRITEDEIIVGSTIRSVS